MNTDEQKLNNIFSEALAKPSPQERDAYLATACSGDQGLRRHVDSLLEAHAEAGDFLRNPVVGPEEKGKCSEGPGTVIGRYKLLQQIGEGGFGIVFMAEQQEPVRRLVALKILKAGMDTKEVVARFEAERQALALMDHPNVARVLDGGTTDTGRPYFVMDLVKGIPITDFCNRNRLSTEARLRLFLEVCAGVQHAHQKGVIHRDLKPTNVLVMVEEGKPVPKVIDFGIAKALGQKLTGRTLFTRFEQLIGTPAYMSPEQAEWGGVDVDTRSDIYSLGSLLYELLTGTTPFERETLARAALDEVRRLIRETDPPNPSLRLQGLGQQLQDIAQQRHSEPKLLTRTLRGELDWIVMKSLEKDRRRRYETANALAKDVERHLRGEAVLACPTSAAYRARKFIRRHRMGVLTATIIAVALAGGLVLSLAALQQVQAERQRANLKAAQQEAMNTFLVADVLGGISPENNPNANLSVRELLDQASEKIEHRLTNDPLSEASIRLAIGDCYLRLGQLDVAERHVRRAIDLRIKTLGPEHVESLDGVRRLANIFELKAEYAEARRLNQRAAQSFQKFFGPDNDRTLEALQDVAKDSMHLGHSAEAESMLRKLLEHELRVCGPTNWHALQTECCLAEACAQNGQVQEAIGILEGTLAFERQEPSWHTEVVLGDLGVFCFRAGDYAKALRYYDESLASGNRRLGAAVPYTSTRNLADMYGALGNWDHAAKLFHKLIVQANVPPEDSCRSAFCGATAALMAEDINLHQEFTRYLLSQFGDCTNLDCSRMVLEATLLAPSPPKNLGALASLAERLPANQGLGDVNRLTKGIWYYRRGQTATALPLLESSWLWFAGGLRAQAGFFCAMARYQQGDVSGATNGLAHAIKYFNSLIPGCRPGLLWHELPRAALARQEAEQLILGREASPAFAPALLADSRARWEPIRRHLEQADRLGGDHRWQEACREYLSAFGEPAFDWPSAEVVDSFVDWKAGIALLLAGDSSAHTRFCQDWFSRLHPDDYDEAYIPMLVCLAGDKASESCRKELSSWSNSLQQHPLAPEAMALLRALLALRVGRCTEALAESQSAVGAAKLGVGPPAQLVHAMALNGLGRGGEALAELKTIELRLTPQLEDRNKRSWYEAALCQVLLNEAHQVLHDHSNAAPTLTQ